MTRGFALFRAVCAGWPKALAADWLKQARQHLEVKQALDIAEREATAENLKAI